MRGSKWFGTDFSITAFTGASIVFFTATHRMAFAQTPKNIPCLGSRLLHSAGMWTLCFAVRPNQKTWILCLIWIQRE